LLRIKENESGMAAQHESKIALTQLVDTAQICLAAVVNSTQSHHIRMKLNILELQHIKNPHIQKQGQDI